MGEAHNFPDDFIEKFDALRKEGKFSHICLYCGGGVNENSTGNHYSSCLLDRALRAENALLVLLGDKQDKPGALGTDPDDIREAWATVEKLRRRSDG